MTYDVRSPLFWSGPDLRAEAFRIALACRSCGRCENLCPSFRTLFDAVGRQADAPPAQLTDAEFDRVADLCFHCRLCSVECPHTPERDPSLRIDFPRLILRHKIVRRRAGSFRRTPRLLHDPDLVGAIGTLTFPLSNWAGRSAAARAVLERLAGLDRRSPFPRFERTTFDRWFRKREKRVRRMSRPGQGKVVLFHSCLVNYCRTEVGLSAVSVLVRHGVEVACPDQRCCGLAHIEGGFLGSAMESAELNVRALKRYVEDGYTVVSLQPDCARMLRFDYPWLYPCEDSTRISCATVDLCDYLLSMKLQDKLAPPSAPCRQRILYHVSCHSKVPGEETAGLRLLRMIPGVSVEPVEGCCGMGRTWGFGPGRFDQARETARPILEAIDRTRPDRIVSDCVSAGLLITSQTRLRVDHPVEVLREAYGYPMGLG